MSMIDITEKPVVFRESSAKGRIRLRPETVKRILEGKIEKGDPFSVAKIAAILGAKNTVTLMPMCHQIPLTNVNIDFKVVDERTIEVVSTVKAIAQTGVEMEALTAVSIALLNIWDMTKMYEKDEEGQYPETAISDIRVIKKVKGKTK